jgi:hypothetical protein
MTVRRPAVAFFLLIGLLALLAVPPCNAQAPGGLKPLRASLDAAPYGQRMDAFRRLLSELGFHPLSIFAELEENPSESLFVMLGDPSCLSEINFPQGLRSFVEQGGAVLIATDKETKNAAGRELRDLAGVVVEESTLVRLDQSMGANYDSSPYCPFVQPIADSRGAKGSTNALEMLGAWMMGGSKPALFRNPHPDQSDLRVAANAPSQVKVLDRLWLSGMYRLAQLPANCVDGATLQRGSKPPLFAIGGTVGKGRVLVLADHSIFINRMILAHDNNNLEFAANCLQWLRGGVSSPDEVLRAIASGSHVEQRNKVLFWDDGTIRSDFEAPLPTMMAPPPVLSEPAIVAAVDKTIAKLEDDNFFNRKLLESIDEQYDGRRSVLRIVVYLLTVAALLFLGYHFLWRIRYQLEPSIPLLTEAIGRHQPALSLLDQRRRDLLRSGNVWEMGHGLTRAFFESAGLTLTTAAPPIARMSHASWRQRWLFRRRLARLWRLARGDAPARLSPAALKQCLRELEELKTALANGLIQLI